MIITSKPYRMCDVDLSLSFDSERAISPSESVDEENRKRIQDWLDEAVEVIGKIYVNSGYGP